MFRTPLFRSVVLLVLTFLLISIPVVSQTPSQPAAAGAQASMGIVFVPSRSTLSLPDGSTTAEMAVGAVVVNYPIPNGPAMTAGVSNGDVLVALNGQRTCDPAQVPEMLKTMTPGQQVELILFRDGGFRTVKVRLANWTELFPSAAVLEPLAKEIADADAKNNYKASRELCKRIPDDLQLETSLSCINAFKFRYDFKALRRAVDGFEIRCHNCVISAYAGTWELSPTTTEGIRANANVIKMLAQYRQTEQNFFDKMDRDFANSLTDLEPKEALAKFTQIARIEGSCRDVPPSPKLVETMVQFARQNNLPIPDDARAKADEARRMEARATDGDMRKAAVRLWNTALWMAPWWSEPYVKSSALLDKLDRPQQAAEVSKLALMIPTAPSSSAPINTPAIAANDTEPATQQSLLKCVGALEATEKGGDAERRTRNRCATIAGKLDTKPAIPEEARRHFARGEAALELGQSPAEFVDAATEFEGALRMAPWWPDAHCDLGQAYEKAANYRAAIFAFQACVAAAPNAANVQDIQKRIYKLEYVADREQKQAINSQIQQRDAELRLQSLAGVWINKESGNPYSAIIKDGLFFARRTPPSTRYYKYQGDYVIKGTVKGDSIEGTFTDPPMYNTENGCTTPLSEMALSGTISPDGKTITVKYQSATFEPHGIRGNLFNPPKCIQVMKIGEQTVMMILQRQE